MLTNCWKIIKKIWAAIGIPGIKYSNSWNSFSTFVLSGSEGHAVKHGLDFGQDGSV